MSGQGVYKPFSILHQTLYNFYPLLRFNKLESGIPLSPPLDWKASAFNRR